jgi:hypothetical protein
LATFTVDGRERDLGLHHPQLTLERLDLGLAFDELALDRDDVGDLVGPVVERAEAGGARGRTGETTFEIDGLRGDVVGRDLLTDLLAESPELLEHGCERGRRDLVHEHRVAAPADGRVLREQVATRGSDDRGGACGRVADPPSLQPERRVRHDLPPVGRRDDIGGGRGVGSDSRRGRDTLGHRRRARRPTRLRALRRA